MMDCKKALGETAGDMDAAIDWLRAKGLSKAAKKAGRTAAEGLVGIAVDGGAGVAVEVNAETDFVARNAEFQAFVKQSALLALKTGGDLDKLKAADAGGETVETKLTNLIAKIGENMALRRAKAIAVSPGVVSAYIHNAAAPDMGKIGVLVALKSEGDAGRLAAFGKQIAMHIAAASPLAVSPADLPQDVVEHEKTVQLEIIHETAKNKPANIIEKMLEGKMRKFFEESVLLSQVFVIDGENQVSKAVENFAKELGAPVEVAGFIRFQVGEGIEKRSDDFADEVSKLAGN